MYSIFYSCLQLQCVSCKEKPSLSLKGRSAQGHSDVRPVTKVISRVSTPFLLWTDESTYAHRFFLSTSCTHAASPSPCCSCVLLRLSIPSHHFPADLSTQGGVSGNTTGNADCTLGASYCERGPLVSEEGDNSLLLVLGHIWHLVVEMCVTNSENSENGPF